MIHAHLDDGDGAGIGKAEERERHADVVIEIAVGLARGQSGFEQARDGVLGGGLTGAAGDADYASAPLGAGPGAEVLERRLRIGDHEFAGRVAAGALHHHGRGALFERGGYVIVAIVVVAA